MPSKVIDLRKPISAEHQEIRLTQQLSPQLKPKEEFSDLRWAALEYEKISHSPYWFIGTGMAAVFFIIIGIFSQSYFFIAFIVFAYVMLIAYAKREPREIIFSISPEGIKIGNKILVFGEIKSFWIFETDGKNELSLETSKILTPFLRIPLDKTDPRSIKNFLQRFIPEKEHEELVTDHIARSLGL